MIKINKFPKKLNYTFFHVTNYIFRKRSFMTHRVLNYKFFVIFSREPFTNQQSVWKVHDRNFMVHSILDASRKKQTFFISTFLFWPKKVLKKLKNQVYFSHRSSFGVSTRSLLIRSFLRSARQKILLFLSLLRKLRISRDQALKQKKALYKK